MHVTQFNLSSHSYITAHVLLTLQLSYLVELPLFSAYHICIRITGTAGYFNTTGWGGRGEAERSTQLHPSCALYSFEWASLM